MKLPINYELTQYSTRKLAREQYIKEQKGNCYYCAAPLSENPKKDVFNKKVNRRLFPPNFFSWPVHLHHSHETGMTIGAVHAHCNAVLWQYEGE